MSSTLIPAENCAAPLNRHPVTLRRNLREGTVPGIKIGGRWYISSHVLDELLAGRDPRVTTSSGAAQTGGAA